jgi:hypothetical protein
VKKQSKQPRRVCIHDDIQIFMRTQIDAYACENSFMHARNQAKNKQQGSPIGKVNVPEASRHRVLGLSQAVRVELFEYAIQGVLELLLGEHGRREEVPFLILGTVVIVNGPRHNDLPAAEKMLEILVSLRNFSNLFQQQGPGRIADVEVRLWSRSSGSTPTVCVCMGR